MSVKFRPLSTRCDAIYGKLLMCGVVVRCTEVKPGRSSGIALACAEHYLYNEAMLYKLAGSAPATRPHPAGIHLHAPGGPRI
jgi:hypothetical protein